jgi:plastocyanin
MKLFVHALAVAMLLPGFATPGLADEQKAEIKLFQFMPGEITIKAGTTITWVNGDDIEHSVTSGTPEKPTKDFDSGYFVKDGKYSQTFNKAGTYEYFCKRHNSMKAKVVVTQ